MEYAHCTWSLDGAWHHRHRRGLWLVLSRLELLSSRSCACPDADVSEALGGRTFDHLSDPYPRSVLVDSPGQGRVDCRARHTGRRNAYGSVWGLHGARWVALCGNRMGLRPCVVPSK